MTAQTSTGVTTVLIVDDHHAFTDLLAMALDAEDDFVVGGTAYTGSGALEVAQRVRPGMVLMDIELGGDDGIDVACQLRSLLPDTIVVVVSAHTDARWVAKAAAAGASAYAAKSGSLTEMLAILRQARDGAVLSAPEVLRGLHGVATGSTPTGQVLTAREHEVLTLMGHGATPAEISRTLSISVHTCRGYVKAIHRKLNARSQLEAVVIAVRLGLIDPAS